MLDKRPLRKIYILVKVLMYCSPYSICVDIDVNTMNQMKNGDIPNVRALSIQ